MPSSQPVFSAAELGYLQSQRLARLATVAPDGAPQNNPVGFHYNPELETFDIYGLRLGATRKFRNVRTNPHVALVVDEIVSIEPWEVRGIEIRGVAEALTEQRVPTSHMSPEILRVHPRRVISWNVDPAQPGMTSRGVQGTSVAQVSDQIMRPAG